MYTTGGMIAAAGFLADPLLAMWVPLACQTLIESLSLMLALALYPDPTLPLYPDSTQELVSKPPNAEAHTRPKSP